MDKIVCRIDPGLGIQHIIYFKDDKMQTEEGVYLKDLIPYLIKVCYKDNCYNVHFLGNSEFISGIIQNLLTEEATQYSTNKIQIEVN